MRCGPLGIHTYTLTTIFGASRCLFCFALRLENFAAFPKACTTAGRDLNSRLAFRRARGLNFSLRETHLRVYVVSHVGCYTFSRCCDACALKLLRIRKKKIIIITSCLVYTVGQTLLLFARHNFFCLGVGEFCVEGRSPRIFQACR